MASYLSLPLFSNLAKVVKVSIRTFPFVLAISLICVSYLPLFKKKRKKRKRKDKVHVLKQGGCGLCNLTTMFFWHGPDIGVSKFNGSILSSILLKKKRRNWEIMVLPCS